MKSDDPKATIFVNGVTVKDEVELHNYDRVILGNNHIFLFIIPTQDPPENAESIDYDFSLQEANAAAASALTGGGGTTPGNDEEMQKRIKDMEAKADEEKKKALLIVLLIVKFPTLLLFIDNIISIFNVLM